MHTGWHVNKEWRPRWLYRLLFRWFSLYYVWSTTCMQCIWTAEIGKPVDQTLLGRIAKSCGGRFDGEENWKGGTVTFPLGEHLADVAESERKEKWEKAFGRPEKFE